ncbi:MAG: holo-ACP synthase [Candidatus Izemoplasmatales bacterium]|nr:holo-ACP synthase [Candidatus Izemoplasmatales bacterium]
MIVGVGVDIVLISRIRESIIEKVLSSEEKQKMASFASDSRKREFLAGRFAVKEAIKKALLEYEGFHSMNELIVVNDKNGRPELISPVFSDKVVHLSISHERQYAVGLCVVETKNL